MNQQTQHAESVLRTLALRSFCALVSLFLLISPTSLSAQSGPPHWVGSWMMAPCAPAPADPRIADATLKAETVRQVVHLSIGGPAVRLRFSNTFGATPLTLGPVMVGHRIKDDTLADNTSVTFSGSKQVTIAPGQSVFSDTVNLVTTTDTDLAISFYVPEKITAPAIHYTALQTSYVANGDQTSTSSFASPGKITLDLILSGVDVATRTSPGAIVAIGSSTTDGAHSTMNANHRWTDDLAARLRAADGAQAYSVLNAGISGGRVLHDGHGDWGPVFGDSAVARFQRDVLQQSGARYVIAFEGGNDIRQPAESTQIITAAQLIQGFQLLARRAHERGLKFIVGTITPDEGTNPEHATPAWQQTRVAFNQWARTAKDIDGIVDFDAAIRDPKHPARIAPVFDSGDHLHPNDAGYNAMAASIDLKIFQ